MTRETKIHTNTYRCFSKLNLHSFDQGLDMRWDETKDDISIQNSMHI
jgi:hypothetical protein